MVRVGNFPETRDHISCTSGCFCVSLTKRKGRIIRWCEPANEAHLHTAVSAGEETKRRDRERGGDPAYLTHSVLHPHTIDRSRKSLLLQIPKLVNGPLIASAGRPEPGWGLHFKEDWHDRIVHLPMGLTLVSYLSYGLFLAVTLGTVVILGYTAMGVVSIVAIWSILWLLVGEEKTS